MSTNNISKNFLLNVNTLEELNNVKLGFLKECEKRENEIKVDNILHNINNFSSAKSLFESTIPSLLSKKEGKNIINNYIKTIKENKSLKTIYSYIEGLNENKTFESKKNYITEALTIGKPISHNEYVLGLGKIVNLISESFKILGDEFVLNNITLNEKYDIIGDSLYYLSTTKKNIKNLNEYFSHIDNICSDTIQENQDKINVDSTLEELVTEIRKNEKNNIDNIFETSDKETSFKIQKDTCLKMIKKQIKENTDKEVVKRLTEIEEKLDRKTYKYETFTNDMLYMNELQEVLK